ncbi:MAG: PAS domain-containing protein [Myxococcales bacterium]|nr:PAS domain-containing protein [Myxococcales bacterium]
MSASSRHPTMAWSNECLRCESLEQELERVRAERDELRALLQEHDRARLQERRQRRLTPIGIPHVAVASAAPAHATGPQGMVSPYMLQRADQGIDFGAVSRLSSEDLDGLPYGLVTLDGAGRVVHYNDTESRLAGLPKDRVIGRNFFQEIAPCTRVRQFEGRFLELVQRPAEVRVQTFDFCFRFAHSEQQVSIVITPARRRGHYHLAMVRRSITAC